MINKTIGCEKLSRKVITLDIAIEKIVNVVIAKVMMKYKK